MKSLSSRPILLPSVILLIGTLVVMGTVSRIFADPFENTLAVDSKKTKLPELVVETRRGEIVFSLAPGQSGSSLASCNSGETLIGGGYSQSLVGNDLLVGAEFIRSDGQYQVIGTNIGSDNTDFFAIANCAHLE